MHNSSSESAVSRAIERVRTEMAAQDAEWGRLKGEIAALGEVQLAFHSLPDVDANQPAPAILGIRG